MQVLLWLLLSLYGSAALADDSALTDRRQMTIQERSECIGKMPEHHGPIQERQAQQTKWVLDCIKRMRGLNK